MRVWEHTRRALSRFIPSHINNPFGLVRRMLTSGKPAATSTLFMTALGIIFTPFDMLLQVFERRRKPVENSNGPHIIICGPARSGTTLVYQILADALPVSYIRNFTLLYSRAPLLASAWFSRKAPRFGKNKYENYYGKTAGLQSPCEANHLWNQWVEPDESGFRTRMTSEGGKKMAQFFKQFSALHQKPTLSKNNNANAFADVIAEHLDNVYFICLQRDTAYLAQSLINARVEINGDIYQNYGVTDTTKPVKSKDPVSEVLEQIQYLDRLAIAQQKKVGAKHFWLVDYETFCEDPAALVTRIQKEILTTNTAELSDSALSPIKNNNQVSNPELFEKLQTAITSHSILEEQPRPEVPALRSIGNS